MAKTLSEHLTDYLSDVYSIEQQALAQMKTAPDIAGEPGMAAAFRDHLDETERHAELVRARLEAHGGSPSAIKDAVMKLGGKSFLAFARAQPDTPGKLLTHAHSYEAFEWAAYEVLVHLAERAGDQTTAAMARDIRDEERAMMERLATRFDAAAEASLGERDDSQMRRALHAYLADAHAIEAQAIQLLEKAPKLAGAPELERIYREHLNESRQHAQWIEQRLHELGGDTSTVKDVALRAAAVNWGLFFQALSETPAKLAVFAYAVEHLEIAAYELLRRVAMRAGDEPTVEITERILPQERAMAERVHASFERAIDVSFADVAVR
ncbi:MAG TPA: DUF892 family protein [Thermoanaerobaculia bacterium]|nr:DUF892 family protein [Thermoanaerobaculia bacterium]